MKKTIFSLLLFQLIFPFEIISAYYLKPVMALKGKGKTVALVFNKAGDRLTAGSTLGRLETWKIPEGKIEKSVEFEKGWLYDLCLSPSLEYFALADLKGVKTGRLVLGRASDGTAVWESTTGVFGYNPSAAVFSRNGDYVAAGYEDKNGNSGDKIQVFSVPDGKVVYRLNNDDKAPSRISALAISPGNKFIAAAYGVNRESVKVWDTASGQVKFTFPHSGVAGMVFSDDGKFLLTGGNDRYLVAWKIPEGRVESVRINHGDSINCIRLSPSGDFFASASNEGLVTIWQASDLGQVISLKTPAPGVYSVAFSPGGDYLAAGMEDGMIYVFQLSGISAYMSNESAVLKTPGGSSAGKLPAGTKITVEKMESARALINASGSVRGWVARKDISFEKPDTMKPVLFIMEKKFKDPELYLRGVVYDDVGVKSVKFQDQTFERADFKAPDGNFTDSYKFEARLNIFPDTRLIITAEDTSGNKSETLVNPREQDISFSPGYQLLEVKVKSPVYEKPEEGSRITREAGEKSELIAAGTSGNWYYLADGNWIKKEAVKKKKVKTTD